jgi:hypothetical protein
MEDAAAKHLFKFFLDAKEYETQDSALSGQQIKQIAGIPAEYQLYLEEEGDEPDKPIQDSDSVDLRGKEKHFFAVPPAVFGA